MRSTTNSSAIRTTPYLQDDGEAADQNVAGPLPIQRPAEEGEVFELRSA
jgi:hypothetical protein